MFYGKAEFFSVHEAVGPTNFRMPATPKLATNGLVENDDRDSGPMVRNLEGNQ
jgi:hypothetical protein